MLSNKFLTELIYNGATKFNQKTNTYACVTPNRTSIITSEQLFPLQRCAFRDFQLSVPNDISVWCHLFTPEVKEQTKSIQKVSLEILKKIDKVCQELSLTSDINVNPMTAVAEGASIFAESIDWTTIHHNRKAANATVNTNIDLTFKYTARTSASWNSASNGLLEALGY